MQSGLSNQVSMQGRNCREDNCGPRLCRVASGARSRGSTGLHLDDLCPVPTWSIASMQQHDEGGLRPRLYGIYKQQHHRSMRASTWRMLRVCYSRQQKNKCPSRDPIAARTFCTLALCAIQHLQASGRLTLSNHRRQGHCDCMPARIVQIAYSISACLVPHPLTGVSGGDLAACRGSRTSLLC